MSSKAFFETEIWTFKENIDNNGSFNVAESVVNNCRLFQEKQVFLSNNIQEKDLVRVKVKIQVERI